MTIMRGTWKHINVIFRNGVIDGEEIFRIAQLKAQVLIINSIEKATFSYSG